MKDSKDIFLGTKIRDAKYYILSGKLSPDSQHFEIYKNTYELWTKTWKKVFGDVGSFEAFSPDDFYRQDYIPVIASGNEPIAAHFYSLFHIDNPAAMDHHYFEIFSEEVIASLRSRGIKKMMSMEFLTVNPEYRKTNTNISFAEIQIVLGSKLMSEINFDIALGVAIKAAKIDKMAIKLGFNVLDSHAKRGNLVCDIVGRHSFSVGEIFHPNSELNSYIENLWSNRIYGDGGILSSRNKVA